MKLFSKQALAVGRSFRFVWELSMLLWFFLYAGFVPFSLSYDQDFDQRLLVALNVIDIISSIFFIIDLYFRIRFFSQKSKLEDAKVVPSISNINNAKTKRQKTAHESQLNVILSTMDVDDYEIYSLWWWYLINLIDFFAILPYTILFSGSIFRLPKLLRVLRVPEIIKAIILHLENQGLVVNAGFHRIIKLAVWYLLLAHWVGCGFFAIGMYSLKHGYRDSWVLNDNVAIYNTTANQVLVPNPIHAYVRSVYWASITMVTVGLGDIVPAGTSVTETIYTILTMYLGMVMTCIFIGNLTSLVANLDAAEDAFHQRMDKVEKYMSYRKLSQELRERIRAYYSYIWTSLRGVDEQKFLSELPTMMRLEVAGLRSKYLIAQISFLRSQKEPLLNAICFQLEQVVVSPGDYVARSGTVIQGAFFLCRGEAELLKQDGSVLQNLNSKSGSVIGENSLFFKEVYRENIRAKSYCELFFLQADKFQKLISDFLTDGEIAAMKQAAEKIQKRSAKVKKFFGLDNELPTKSSWRQIFEPQSLFRDFWNLLSLLGVCYNVLLIPLRIAFLFDVKYTLTMVPYSFVLDWAFDFLFFIDIIFRARYFGFHKEGILITDKQYIFIRYQETGIILLDLIIFLPLDMFYLVFPNLDFSILAILRITKMLRFVFLSYHYSILRSYLERRKISFSNSVHRIIQIFFSLFVIVHWVGCGWIFMAKLTYHKFEADICRVNGSEIEGCRTDWITLDESNWALIKHEEKIITYIRAVYFVVVDMTTVGYGDLVPIRTGETAYVVIITLVGGFLYPAVVGAMAALLSNVNAAQQDFVNKIKRLEKYMELNRFPDTLRTRITRFYDYLWSRQRGVDEDFILNDLPGPLRTSVQEYINGNIIRNVPFFKNCEPEMLRQLLSVLKPAVFLPGDVIIRGGELGREMYLLERGGTKVTSADGKVVYAVLAPGDYFGEGCLLKAEARTATVRAIGYCDCFVLHKDDFDRISSGFQNGRSELLKNLLSTLEKKKNENAKYMKNLSEYPKLSQITSMKDDKAKAVPSTSFRHPESKKRHLWNVLILFIVFYNVMLIPLRLSFNVALGLYGVDYFFDLILIIDILLRRSYFGFTRDGEVFTDKTEVKENYIKARKQHILDIISMFPYELLIIPILLKAIEDDNPELALVRVPKLFLCVRVFSLLKYLDRLIQSGKVITSSVIYRLFMLAMSVFVVSHYAACFFYLITKVTGDKESMCNSTGYIDYTETGFCPLDSLLLVEGGDVIVPAAQRENDFIPDSQRSCGALDHTYCQWKDTWIELQLQWGLLPLDGGTEIHKYIRALYWAIPTLVVVVIGDIVPVTVQGTLYVLIGILFGVIVNANIIGNIANLVANLEGESAVFRQQIDRLENFLVMHDLPPHVQNKLHSYYDYLWETKKGHSEAYILGDMPSTLRYEVSSFLKLQYVKDCAIFSDCDIALQKAVSFALVTRVYSPEDFIINQGDLAFEVFFVVNGTVQMVVMNDSWIPDSPASVLGQDNLQVSNEKPKRGRRMSLNNVSMLTPQEQTAGLIVLSTQGPGSCFGESGVFANERRSCSVLAIDFTETYVLHKDSLNELLMRYPFESTKMYKVIKKIRASNSIRNERVRCNFLNASKEGHKLHRFVRENLVKNANAMTRGFHDSERKSSTASMDSANSQVFSSRRAAVGRYKHRNSIFESIKAVASPKRILGNRENRLGRNVSSVHPETDSRRKSVDDSYVKWSRKNSKKISVARSRSYEALQIRQTAREANRRRHDQVVISLERISQKKQKRRYFRRWVFHPYSGFVTCWNILSLLGLVYYSISIPYRLAFYVPGRRPFLNENKHDYIPTSVIIWVSMDYVFDLFFIVDVIMRSRYFATIKLGKIFNDSSSIFDAYKRSWLWIDILSVLPLELILLLNPPFSGGRITLLSLCKLNKFLRVFHLIDLSSTIISYIHSRYPGTDSSLIQPRNHNTWAIVDGLATFNLTTGEHNVMDVDDEGRINSLFCWLRAFYFVITTLSSVGYGDIRPYTQVETVFEIFVVLSGACMFAAIIGTVAMWCFFNDSRGIVAFKAEMSKYKSYMKFRELPDQLQDQIIRHFVSTWKREKGVKFNDIMNEVPKPLQLEIAICVNEKIIRTVRGFRLCHIHVQQHIATVLHPQSSGPDDYVYRVGEIGTEIYFVLEGEVKISRHEKDKKMAVSSLKKIKTVSRGKVHEKRIISAGGNFGAGTLYSVSGERLETAQCLTECQLYYIEKCDFERILREFPEHATIGIFAEIVDPNRKTVFQKKIQLEAFDIQTGNFENMTPLDNFASQLVLEAQKPKVEKTADETTNHKDDSVEKLWKLRKNKFRSFGSRSSQFFEDIEDKLKYMVTKKS